MFFPSKILIFIIKSHLQSTIYHKNLVKLKFRILIFFGLNAHFHKFYPIVTYMNSRPASDILADHKWSAEQTLVYKF
jgi:hypothetical protein